MGHLYESPARCVEPQHVQDDRECTWLTMMSSNETSYIRYFDSDDLREIALALSTRYVSALHNHQHDRATRILAILRDLSLV